MRTNPHSRHGKCGRLRFSGILDARAKADDARQLQEMRRKIGLPAGFRSVQTLGPTSALRTTTSTTTTTTTHTTTIYTISTPPPSTSIRSTPARAKPALNLGLRGV
jgi:hypothetical protein